MLNKKLILLSVIALLILGLATGCGSSEKAAAPAPSAPAKTPSGMPNEDPMPIAQDLERKLNDTVAKIKEGKIGEAKIIMVEAVKTKDRLSVHITDTRTKDTLNSTVKEANEAVNASPADAKSTEAKIGSAVTVLKQAMVQLQGHKH